MTVTRTVGTVEAPVAQQAQAGEAPAVPAPRLGDWVITGAGLVFFAAAFVLAEEWPAKAALFPQIVSTAGFLLSALKAVGLVLATLRSRRSAAGVGSAGAAAVAAGPATAAVPVVAPSTSTEPVVPASAADDPTPQGPTSQGSDVALVDDDQEEDESMEYVFASAGGRAWASALAWIVAFFVAFAVLGAFVAVPVFAFVYLRFAGKASWLAAALYAAVTGGLIYLVFREVVYLPLPTGVIPFLQGI